MDMLRLVEFGFMCTVGFLALCVWTGFIMLFMYGALRLVFPKKAAEGATASEAEPGQPKKKFAKALKEPALAAAAPAQDFEAPVHMDDAEEYDLEDAAPRRTSVAPTPKKSEPAASSIADRLANDFDAQQVTA